MSTFLAEGSGANMPIQQWPFAIGQEDPVLVVDDQVVMGDLTRRLLARLGFENVEYTTDGHHALALLRDKKHKLVVSDLHMEAMGGIQLLRAVRADDQLKGTPFILMTGSVGISDVFAAKYAGTDAYLLKPFTKDQLRAKIHEALS
jgi:two-component system, chemotaxis family, chemotaxis protein CheY